MYCPRGLADNVCMPLSNILSTPVDGVSTFFCVGQNDPSVRKVPGDRFRVCFKNSVIDEMGDWDKRDILDQVSVFTMALSIDENYRVSASPDITERDLCEQSLPEASDPDVSPFSAPGVWKPDALIEFYGEGE